MSARPSVALFSLAPGAALLSSFSSGNIEAVKWLGVVAMLIEHIHTVLFGVRGGWPVEVGRLAFPLFAFAFALSIAERASVRSFRACYRLAGWACLAQVFSVWARGSGTLSAFAKFSLGVLALFSCVAGAAESMCPRYVAHNTADPPGEFTEEGTSAQSVCTAGQGHFASYWGGAPDAHLTKTQDQASGTGWICGGDIKRNSDNGRIGGWALSVSLSGTMACPEEPCAASAGSSSGIFTGDGDPPPMICSDYEGHSCRMVPDAMTIDHWGGYVGYYKYIGTSCDGEPAKTETTANCVSGSGGSLCLSKQAQNCGTVNGEAVCLDSVPAGNCLLLSGGGAVCADGAAGAPTDSMGDAVDPLARFTKTTNPEGGGSVTTDSFNFYSSTVVNSSGTPVVGADNPGSGSSGSGGDGDGEGVEECDSDGDCFGEEPSDSCGDDLVSCIGEAASGVYSSFGATPLISAVTGLYASIPDGGECPSATVEVYGTETDAMGSFCSVMASSGGGTLLELFFAIGWCLAGLRILVGGGE